jgi:hypothetical protein
LLDLYWGEEQGRSSRLIPKATFAGEAEPARAKAGKLRGRHVKIIGGGWASSAATLSGLLHVTPNRAFNAFVLVRQS